MYQIVFFCVFSRGEADSRHFGAFVFFAKLTLFLAKTDTKRSLRKYLVKVLGVWGVRVPNLWSLLLHIPPWCHAIHVGWWRSHRLSHAICQIWVPSIRNHCIQNSKQWSWGRKRWKANGEKMRVFGADVFAVYAELFTAYKGDKRWKKHLVIDDLFQG